MLDSAGATLPPHRPELRFPPGSCRVRSRFGPQESRRSLTLACAATVRRAFGCAREELAGARFAGYGQESLFEGGSCCQEALSPTVRLTAQQWVPGPVDGTRRKPVRTLRVRISLEEARTAQGGEIWIGLRIVWSTTRTGRKRCLLARAPPANGRSRRRNPRSGSGMEQARAASEGANP